MVLNVDKENATSKLLNRSIFFFSNSSTPMLVEGTLPSAVWETHRAPLESGRTSTPT